MKPQEKLTAIEKTKLALLVLLPLVFLSACNNPTSSTTNQAKTPETSQQILDTLNSTTCYNVCDKLKNVDSIHVIDQNKIEHTSTNGLKIQASNMYWITSKDSKTLPEDLSIEPETVSKLPTVKIGS